MVYRTTWYFDMCNLSVSTTYHSLPHFATQMLNQSHIQPRQLPTLFEVLCHIMRKKTWTTWVYHVCIQRTYTIVPISSLWLSSQAGNCLESTPSLNSSKRNTIDWFKFNVIFLAVTWQLYRFPCHSLTHWVTESLTAIVEKHCQRALWETCDPWDMWPEW